MDLRKIKEDFEKRKKEKTGMSFSACKKPYMLYYDLNDNWFLQIPQLIEDGETSYYNWSNYEQLIKIKKENILDSIKKIILKKEKILDTKGSIYLITDGEYTKIGATSYEVQKRLFELQTGNAKKLKLVYEYKVKNKLSTEIFLHEKFKDKKVLGEWFKLDFKDIEYIIKTKPTIEKETNKITIKEEQEILYCIKKLKKEQEEKLDKVTKRHEYKIYEFLKYMSKKINLKDIIKNGYMKFRMC